MADNTPQNGTATVAGDEVSYSGDTAQVQLVQLGVVSGNEGSRTVAKLADANGLDVDIVRDAPPQVKIVKTTFTRPNNATAYSANDSYSTSTSAPTSGGETITDAARSSGGAGTITGVVVTMSGGSVFQGELLVFDQSVTNTNDNDALSVSDADIKNMLGVIPFYTSLVTAVNSYGFTDCELDFVCVGSANLRFLVKVVSGFTPVAQEVLSIAWKIRQ